MNQVKYPTLVSAEIKSAYRQKALQCHPDKVLRNLFILNIIILSAIICLQGDYPLSNLSMDEKIPTRTHLFVQTLLLPTLTHVEGGMNKNCSSQDTHQIAFLYACNSHPI